MKNSRVAFLETVLVDLKAVPRSLIFSYCIATCIVVSCY